VWALSALLICSAGCQKVKKLLGQDDEPPEEPAVVYTAPEGIDAEQWKVLQAGLGELDDATLRALVPASADIIVEFRPEVLRQQGLWQPILESLPAEGRAAYQQAVDAVGSDVFVRVDNVVVALRFPSGSIKSSKPEPVAILGRAHGGALVDLIRWVRDRPAKDSKSEADGVLVLSESLDAAARETLTKPLGDNVVQVSDTALIGFDDSEANFVDPDGVLTITADTALDTAGAVKLVLTQLRRIASARETGADPPEDQLLRVKALRFPLGNEVGRGEVSVRLSDQLRIAGNVLLPRRGVQVAMFLEAFKRPGVAQKIVDSASRKGLSLWGPVLQEALRSLKLQATGEAVRFEASVNASTLLSALGGAVYGLPKEATAMGKGLDARDILSVPAARPALRRKAEIAASAMSAAAGKGAVGFVRSNNARSRKIADWLSNEGTLSKMIESIRGRIKWPRTVPVNFADCGMVNAFYAPDPGTIVLCYELVDDLLTKLRGRVSEAQLGPAVVGASLFILLHEYGHAMVHQLGLPATGKEEDAVDQVATLVLLGMGEKGTGYAIAAQHWFTASRSVLKRAPFWDEHSTSEQRFYTLSCLMYGSDPPKYASWAGSNWLPTARAKRCPREYAKINGAWSKLLAPHLKP